MKKVTDRLQSFFLETKKWFANFIFDLTQLTDFGKTKAIQNTNKVKFIFFKNHCRASGGRMPKGPGLKFSVLQILVIKCKFWSNNGNINPKLKKAKLCNFGVCKNVQKIKSTGVVNYPNVIDVLHQVYVEIHNNW